MESNFTRLTKKARKERNSSQKSTPSSRNQTRLWLPRFASLPRKHSMSKYYLHTDVTCLLPVQVYSYVFGILLIVTVATTIVSTHEAFRVSAEMTNLNQSEYENETNPKILLHLTTRPHLSLTVSSHSRPSQ